MQLPVPWGFPGGGLRSRDLGMVYQIIEICAMTPGATLGDKIVCKQEIKTA